MSNGDEGLPKDRPRGVLHKIWSGFLSYGVVVICLVFLFTKLDDSEDMSTAFAMITATQVVIICLLGVVNLGTNLPPFVVTLPGLKFREAGVTNTASAALSNTVPEGGAIATGLNYAMLRSWGFTYDDITSEVIITGVWSQMTKFTLFALSLLAVAALESPPSGTIWFGLILSVLVIIAGVLLALILRSERFARRLGKWIDSLISGIKHIFKKLKAPTMAAEIPKFRGQMVERVSECWGRLTITMVLSQLTACFVLGVACRMQGLDESTIPWSVIVLAYSCVIFASLLIPTPGGLGVAEVVLVAVLSYGLPDSDQAAVLAAVILYRIATFLVPIPIGLVTYLYWRRSTKWRLPPDTRRVVPAV